MTIRELYEYLHTFIRKHPQCLDKPIMVKNPLDESSWEEVGAVVSIVPEHCPQYGSPLYFHSKNQEKVCEKYYNKIREKNEKSIDEYDSLI